MFQFVIIETTDQLSGDTDILLSYLGYAVIALAVALFLLGVVFIIRAILQAKNRRLMTAERVLLEITVPKERKSDGQNGQINNDDRLEQIREEISVTESFFSAIAGLKAESGLKTWFKGRSDHFSFEIVIIEGLIYFYVETPRRLRELIEHQIHAQFPYAEITEIADYNIFREKSAIVGAILEGTANKILPFKTYRQTDSDPLSSTLNALSKIRDQGSSAAIQYIVRPAASNWRKIAVGLIKDAQSGKQKDSGMKAVVGGLSEFSKDVIKSAALGPQKDDKKSFDDKKNTPPDEEKIKHLQNKIGKGGLDVSVRLLSVSDSTEVAKMNLNNLITAFNQYNLYQFGNSLKSGIPRGQGKLIRDFIYRTFHEKRNLILSTEEITSFWHLPIHATEAPNIKWLAARRAPPPPNLPKNGLLLGHVEYRGLDAKVHIKEADRRRHQYIIGRSGGGKSWFIAGLAIQDIKAGHGVCVVDPHGDLVEDILEHIPKERADDVIVFSPADMDRPVGLNMLEAKTDDQKDFAVQEMIGIFYKLFPPEMMGPMFEHNMRNVMLTLMADIENPGTVIDIPRMFTDDSYVKKYLKKLKDPVVRAFWEKEMAKTSDFHKSEMLGYLISKVGRFVENEMMRNIMGQQKSGFNFRDIMDKQKILLVNLSKGMTGETNAKLLGLIVVAKLQMAALGRADIEQKDRKDFFLYIDEFQNFITDSISTILSEARKYRLNLIVAHQYMNQLTDDKGRSDIRSAVLGNVGTMNVFRVGPEDVEILSKEFAPTFGGYDLLNAPQFSCYTKLLIDNTASKPFNMLTYPLPSGANKELAKAIKQLSRLKYGRDRHIVESEILDRTKLSVAESGGKTNMIEATL